MHSRSAIHHHGDDMFTSIHSKLIAVWLLACLAMILLFVMTLRYTHEGYHVALRQEISRPLARVLVEETPGLSAEPNVAGGWQATLARYARINPEIVAYLVNQNGEVVASSLPLDELKLRQVDIQPIRQHADGAQRALTGIDPLDPTRPKAFSSEAVPGGFLYVVLRNPANLGVAQQMRTRDAYLQTVLLVVCGGVMAALAGIVTVRVITRPLRQLNTVVDQFRTKQFSDDSNMTLRMLPSTNDEVGRLSRAIAEMSSRIVSQVKELETNDKVRRELFANISHDLRTPLTSMLGYLETVANAKNMTESERQRYCGIAMQEAHVLSGMIDDLLELIKLETPGVPVALAPFLMSELVTSVAARFSHSATEKGISILAPATNQTQWVNADSSLISRLLENLIGNALRHTPSGGNIGIELDVRSEKAATVMTTTVWDTGSGISPEDLPQIFDRFFRGEKSRQIASSGVGLGLAICKRILELHKSTMLVASTPGHGSRFSFTLPVVKFPDVQSERTKDPEPATHVLSSPPESEAV